MIREVDESIIESLRRGLSDLVPGDNITIGELDPEKPRSISLEYKDFTVEEVGIGGSTGVKKEEKCERFESDGEKKDFSLSQKPLSPLISVETPIGNKKRDIDDYTIDYNNGIVTFRISPEKGEKIQARYHIARSVAEIRNLKFLLTYLLNIQAEDIQERNSITLEAIKVLYRERAELEKHAISEISLIKGYSDKSAYDKEKSISVIEFKAETTIQIELPLPPIERIELKNIKK